MSLSRWQNAMGMILAGIGFFNHDALFIAVGAITVLSSIEMAISRKGGEK